MKTIDTVSTIVERVHSTEDLEKIETEISVWINDGGSFHSTMLSPDQVEQLTTTIDNNQRVNLSRPEVVLNLNKLRQALHQLPVLELVCPFVPDPTFKQEVIRQLQKSVTGNFVAKFSTKTELIAGMQLIFKGKFKDYSLLKQLEDRKAEIFGEVLR